jgi:hypothetical protein
MKQFTVSQGNPARVADIDQDLRKEDAEAGACGLELCRVRLAKKSSNEGDRYYDNSPKQSDSKFAQFSQLRSFVFIILGCGSLFL